MELNEAITIIHTRLFGYGGKIPEAWKIVREAALKLAEGQKPSTNNARDKILLCAAHYPCQYQDDIKCTAVHACKEQRETSPIA